MKIHGTIWNNSGRWNWRVRLPGELKRTNHPLIPPRGKTALSAERPYSEAERIALKMWDDAAREQAGDSRLAAISPIDAITVDELIDKWAVHAREYYRHVDGTPTSEVKGSLIGLRALRTLYGRRHVADLSHPEMLRVRDYLIERGLAVKTINSYLGYIRRLMKWALDEALIGAQAKAELSQVSNIKRGRSSARDTEDVRPVAPEFVKAVQKALPPSLADMIQVQLLTGMRPGEVCIMRWEDIERRTKVWVYRPTDHKNLWRRQPRAVVIGPRAQKILSKYEGQASFVFSPRLALAERYRAAQKNAVELPRTIGDHWHREAYTRAIARVCEALKIPTWSPNRLRHNCATEVRRHFGISAARAVLGHSFGDAVTDRYSFDAAEDEIVKVATPSMLSLG